MRQLIRAPGFEGVCLFPELWMGFGIDARRSRAGRRGDAIPLVRMATPPASEPDAPKTLARGPGRAQTGHDARVLIDSRCYSVGYSIASVCLGCPCLTMSLHIGLRWDPCFWFLISEPHIPNWAGTLNRQSSGPQKYVKQLPLDH